MKSGNLTRPQPAVAQPHPADAGWRTRNIGRLLFDATGAFGHDKFRVLGDGRLTEAHMALVQNLDVGGTRLTEAAARAGMTKQSMLELVDKVAALGLVERRPDAGDRRAKVIAFTPDGVRLLECLRAGVDVAERRLVAVTGARFVDGMKAALGEYARSSGLSADWLHPDVAASWRTTNAGRRLAHASRAFAHDALRAVQEAGFGHVTAGHQMLLRHLDLAGNRPTELAARARVTKQAMAELVGRAEASGLVARRDDPADGRARTVAFPPAGLHLLDRFRDGIAGAERRMEAVTGKSFVEQLRRQMLAYLAATAALFPPGRPD